MKRHLFYLAALVLVSMSSCDNSTSVGGIICMGGDFVNSITNDETGEVIINNNDYTFSFQLNSDASSVTMIAEDISIPSLSIRYFTSEKLPFAFENGAYCFSTDTINIAGVIFTDLKAQIGSASSLEYKSAAGYTIYATYTENSFPDTEITITDKLEPESEPYEYSPYNYMIELDIETMTATMSIYTFRTSAIKDGIDIYLSNLDLEIKDGKFIISADNATVETNQEGVTPPEVTNLYAEIEDNKFTFTLDYNDSYTVTGSGTPK